MAITLGATKQVGSVGRMKAKIFDVTFGAADTSGEIKTGLSNIQWANWMPRSSDDHGIMYLNFSDAGTTAAKGSVFIDSISNDDEGKLLVLGF